jgi:hypothetical protein
MKTRLNLTIDEHILESMKNYAQKKGESISEIVENHFTTIIKNKKKKKNIVQLVEGLQPPVFDPNADLKDLFYKDQAKKHGF